ncbi:MAG: hypothetical protein Q4D34_05845, partial [Eggerthellaceae bacterium]|nr:hypothetical protein [Eggerthellaceae bacterium]
MLNGTHQDGTLTVLMVLMCMMVIVRVNVTRLMLVTASAHLGRKRLHSAALMRFRLKSGNHVLAFLAIDFATRAPLIAVAARDFTKLADGKRRLRFANQS